MEVFIPPFATLITIFLALDPLVLVSTEAILTQPSNAASNLTELQLLFNAERDMVFYLYNKMNSEEIIQLNNRNSLQKSRFQPELPTRIFISGYLSNAIYARSLRDVYLAKGGVNNIYVDWRKGAQSIFYNAVALIRVPAAGRVLARFVDFLVNNGASYDTTYLIGHSLGAHIAGIAGKNTAKKVNTIFGLDPAGPPLFFLNYPAGRIARGDAKYVEIIHTNDFFGFYQPLGDADFYVNGGRDQPGCFGKLGSLCSHLRVVSYFEDSVRNNKFRAAPCRFTDIEWNNCHSKNRTVKMGGEPSNGALANPPRGTYYLRVNCKTPFCLFDIGDLFVNGPQLLN